MHARPRGIVATAELSERRCGCDQLTVTVLAHFVGG
jgi:hypothetical protein